MVELSFIITNSGGCIFIAKWSNTPKHVLLWLYCMF